MARLDLHVTAVHTLGADHRLPLLAGDGAVATFDVHRASRTSVPVLVNALAANVDDAGNAHRSRACRCKDVVVVLHDLTARQQAHEPAIAAAIGRTCSQRTAGG